MRLLLIAALLCLPTAAQTNKPKVISGHGVTARGKRELQSNLDIAPTIAKLLGITLPTAQGKPLSLR